MAIVCIGHHAKTTDFVVLNINFIHQNLMNLYLADDCPRWASLTEMLTKNLMNIYLADDCHRWASLIEMLSKNLKNIYI